MAKAKASSKGGDSQTTRNVQAMHYDQRSDRPTLPLNHLQTNEERTPFSEVQSMVLSFFHSFQQDSTAMNDQRFKSMATKLDKEMDMYILNHALSSQCNLTTSSDAERIQDEDSLDEESSHEDSSPRHENDFVTALRQVLWTTLIFAARSYVSELKGQSTDLSLFLNSPPVKILKLLSFYFFKRTAKHCSTEDCADLILEVCDKISTKSLLEEDVRAILCWWLGTCITQIFQNLATDSRRGTTMENPPVLDKKDPIHNLLERMNTVLLHLILEDKSQKIRYAAIIASCGTLEQRIHHPESFDTPQVLNCLLFSMANDSSCQNRSAVLCNIPVYEDTLSPIIKRIRDVHPKVRVDAVHVLETKADVFQLSTQQRVDILRFGLTPRCKKTFEATATLLCCSWLKSMKFDTIALVRLLDPVMNEQVCETVIQTILTVAFNTTFISPDAAAHDIIQSSFVDIQHNIQDALSEHEIHFWKSQISQLTVNLSSSRRTTVQEGEITAFDCPSSLYLRCYIQWVLRTKAFPENHLTNALPDVPSLCQVLVDINAKVQDLMEENDAETSFDGDDCLDSEKDLLFTCKQLFLLFQFIDLKEEGSRRHFLGITTEILSSVDTHIDIIISCLSAMKNLFTVDADFLNTIATILTNINKKYPDSLQEMKDIHCLDILSASLTLCSRMAILTNKDLFASRTQRSSSHRGNRPSHSVAVSQIPGSPEGTIDDLSCDTDSNRITVIESFSQLILSAVTSNEPDIRETAVECLGRFTLLLDERQVLEKYKPLFVEISRNVHEKDEIRAQAIMAQCDLTILFPSMLSPVVVNESQSISYLQSLETLLTTSKSSLLYVAAECVLKLFFADRIHDSNLLAHLVLLYFGHDPNMHRNQDDLSGVGSPIRLHQLLTLFFPAYGMKSTTGKETLLHSCTDVRRLVQEQVNVVKGRGRRGQSTTSQWPLDKMLDFLETCAENEEAVVEQGEDTETEE